MGAFTHAQGAVCAKSKAMVANLSLHLGNLTRPRNVNNSIGLIGTERYLPALRAVAEMHLIPPSLATKVQNSSTEITLGCKVFYLKVNSCTDRIH
jgi:hypothetical protein